MRKKDILELKRRFKKDHCTFTKMCGCYVNSETLPSTEVNDDNVVLEEDSETTLEKTEETSDTDSEDDNLTPDYDVILQVKSEKVNQIKSEIINGQKCIVIPINENEQTTVNVLDDSI